MLDLIKKTMMTGIGLALKTKEEVEELAKDIMSKAELSENDGRKLLDDLLKKYDEAKGMLEDRVEKIVKDMLKKANVATKDEVEGLKKEIMALKKKLD